MATNDDLVKQNRELIAELERLNTAPAIPAIVVAEFPNFIHVHSNNGPILVEKPKSMPPLGSWVRVAPDSSQIVDRIPLGFQSDLDVFSVVGLNPLQIDSNGSTSVGFCSPSLEVKLGDKVLVHRQSKFVTAVLPSVKKEETKTYQKVKWDEIGGLEEAKLAIRESVEFPITFGEIFARYKKNPSNGFLFYGPPGCGKTLLGRATATAVGSDAFLYVKGPEILDPYVGVAEANLRSVFQEAKKNKEKTGKPSVIFIDEAESILAIRGGHYAQMEKTIVPTFLTEVGSMDKNVAIVILASNRADLIDPAVIRDGRIDRKIHVPRPAKSECENIFRIHLRDLPLSSETNMPFLATAGTHEVFEGGHVIVNNLPLASLISGALIEGIVNKAISFALHRDIKEGGKRVSGLKIDDISAAVRLTAADNLHIDHRE